MALFIAYGLASLIVILISCEFFTNAIEWTGEKFNLHHGVTGSILAAVGTALPETLIPIIAILFVPGQRGEDIGIGAILGAPFMLSTLAFGVTGLAVLFYHFRNGRSLTLDVDDRVLSNDFIFFSIVYVLAMAFSFMPAAPKKLASPIFLVIYGIYIYKTFKLEGVKSTEPLRRLYFSRKKSPGLAAVLLQDLASLAGIVAGARFFVYSIEHLAALLDVQPLIFSLFLAPVATELPEKFNSIMWVRRRKDTLALGNISGAMVFQSSAVVFVGIVGTKWILSGQALLSAAITLISSGLVIGYMKALKKLNAQILLAGLALYVVYIIITACYRF